MDYGLVVSIVSFIVSLFTISLVVWFVKTTTTKETESPEEPKVDHHEPTKSQKEFEKMLFGSSEPNLTVLRVPEIPLRKINPKLDEIEKELDGLEDKYPNLRGSEYDRKEAELISKMVDIIIRETDKRMILESKASGSHEKENRTDS